jgi:hypothetical protein
VFGVSNPKVTRHVRLGSGVMDNRTPHDGLSVTMLLAFDGPSSDRGPESANGLSDGKRLVDLRQEQPASPG